MPKWGITGILGFTKELDFQWIYEVIDFEDSFPSKIISTRVDEHISQSPSNKAM
jgi:hypothetical protein